MIVGIARVKDEADVIASTVGHMLTQVDHVIVEDNGSTDGTLEILAGLPVELLHDPTVGYYQSAAMSRLAATAAKAGAEWVIPFDADEVWYSPFGRIADVLGGQSGASIATAALYDHVATGVDPDSDPITRMGWRRREATPLPKVACRPLAPVTIHQGNHSAGYGTTVDGLLIVRHYPLRSPEQMIRKARNGGKAYAATTLPEHVGQHWRDWDRLTDEQLGDVFRTWYWVANPAGDSSLIFDPAPVACPSQS